MVNSNIDSSVTYKESRNIDSNDINFTSDIYRGSLYKKNINFILGKPNYKYIENGIIYLNIYLVNLNKIIAKIGVYELDSKKYSKYLDETNTIDVNRLEIPLLFKFSEILIKDKYILQEESESKRDDDIKEESKTKSDDKMDDKPHDKLEDLPKTEDKTDSKSKSKYIKDSKEKKYTLPLLKSQTLEESNEEKRIYNKDDQTTWIEEFMSNNNYKLINNEGGGDCLFSVIRDGLEKINKKISVKEMRARLSQEATQEVFMNYKEQYDMFLKTYQILNLEQKKIVEKNNQLRDKIKEITIHEEQKKIIKEASILSQRHKQIKDELALTKELLKDFLFMKNVKTLGDFKDLINTCDFWAETWAISTLERILNIKLIILSSQQWRANDRDNILQCGQLNDTLLYDKNEFNPDHYIIIDYSGDHYKLISYKNRGALLYDEIPYDIKMLVVNKCMERQAGPYYIIPEFKRLLQELQGDDLNIDDTKLDIINDLYTNDVTFQFYIKSNDKPLPGKGVGETIIPDKVKNFTELSKIKDWRKKLSNSWSENPIKLDGLTWLTVEHYYNGNKFKIDNIEFYKEFSMESMSDISKDPDLARAAGSNNGKLGSRQVRDKKITLDKDFEKQSNIIMEKVMYAKFTQHEELKKVLIATRDAKLVHFVRARPPEVFENLMNVRKMIIK